ncbi:MAG: HNH endonuclease [Cyanomargarita calcarea GSE-NOS-MK-12-04C]|jgi:RNA-directed DNA polymerase|uniref:HNH endonuclease n=1 Tax=Cyanomargarita calcarea GSE-NOS-MK-12-04C TaxID=2839659 RepID=A0A951USS7_9CYAN|nr:HNH endonuclease [Cyanomargarita calcarea GSE-NOS-MK-12-04C]
MLKFREEDVLEVDHINSTVDGGKDDWKNLQLLHPHCHDEKTHIHLIKIRNNVRSDILNKLAHFWKQVYTLSRQALLNIRWKIQKPT